MNIISNCKYFFNAYQNIPKTESALSVSVRAILRLRIPSKFLLSSLENCKYSSLCSSLNSGFCGSSKKSYHISCSSKSQVKEASVKSAMLGLADNDCIGFDLDNTICEYNISSSVRMEYNTLANFLVIEKGYDASLLKPLDSHAIDFLQKGLIIDFERGNILKMDDSGVIFKASHGTKLLTKEEIEITYGKDRKWQVTSDFAKNLLLGCEGPISEKIRALLDYFDMPASLAFARIIDSFDNKLEKTENMVNVWIDVKEGLSNMYKREHFIDGKGGYFQEIKKRPHDFIKKCDSEVIEWLTKMKESKVTFLITGSNCDFASLTAETCLGKNWRSLFDIIVCYARKPGFFTGCRPFVRLEQFKETSPIDGSDLLLGQMYSQGNWQELYQLFARKVGKNHPKCLYFGDNLIQDIYTPSEYTKCDTVAIVEELYTESKEIHNARTILESAFWGSYFYDNKEQISTIWGSVIKRNAKLCVPSLSVLARHSLLNNELPTFSNQLKMR